MYAVHSPGLFLNCCCRSGATPRSRRSWRSRQVCNCMWLEEHGRPSSDPAVRCEACASARTDYPPAVPPPRPPYCCVLQMEAYRREQAKSHYDETRCEICASKVSGRGGAGSAVAEGGRLSVCGHILHNGSLRALPASARSCPPTCPPRTALPLPCPCSPAARRCCCATAATAATTRSASTRPWRAPRSRPGSAQTASSNRCAEGGRGGA